VGNKLHEAAKISQHPKPSLLLTTDYYSTEVNEKRKVSDVLYTVSTTLTASINFLSKI
jgi:hypothetical protein